MSINSKILSNLFLSILFIFPGCIQGGKIREAAKLNQYMVEGMKLYRLHCSNCHQVDGTGLAKLYPPLKDADYLNDLSSEEFACQIRNGLRGEIVVNGISFSQEMPGIPSLTPLEIAEIVTYVNNTWSEQKGLFDVKSAEKALKSCQ